MTPFDLYGALPTGTTMLEASAGTGKTYTIAGLVARYVAEGVATLDELLVITFGRAASQELRERVREQLVRADKALSRFPADPATIVDDPLLRLLTDAPAVELARRRKRLRDALAGFDGATIATTHQFCQLVLRSLGVAGDTDAHAQLVDNLDDLVEEVVDDLFLRRYGASARPPFDRATAVHLGRVAVNDPQAALTERPAPAERVAFAEAVRAELDVRKRRLGVLSYDDLLSRLATALADPDSPARERMLARWKVVLVDEFQDTDPVQWQVLDRAFRGAADLVLIGDPKQAIYAFRGGDVHTYLVARDTAAEIATLDTNWRSDAPLVDALQVLTRGAALGDPAITVHPIRASHAGSRLEGAPCPAPLRLRRVPVAEDSVGIGPAREQIATDLAADVAALLTSGATYDGAPIEAGHVAILMQSLSNAPLYQRALLDRGIPSVLSGGASVLTTQAGADWVALLEALEQPHRTGRVRALALSAFLGYTAADLDAGGDDLTDRIAERVRGWLDLVRVRGIAAVYEDLCASGLPARVLGLAGGERLLTDLDHVGEVLHEIAHRDHLGVGALLHWLREERARSAKGSERLRRLDTDAKAVQLVTIHASKGQQYPVVYLPELFNRWGGKDTDHLFHQDGVRTLDITGSEEAPPQARREWAGEELRLTYVALTRAQSQVVTWWAPTRDAANSGFTRLLFGREPGAGEVADRAVVPPSDVAGQVLERWAAAGALTLEEAVPPGAPASLPPSPPSGLEVRTFDRGVDTTWRRTSYSGLIRAEVQVGVGSEPEEVGTVDEAEAPLEGTPEPRPDLADLPSPMEGLPAGATFGSLVHGVLEHADPRADDLLAELRARVVEQQQWWSVDAAPEALAEALVPMHLTPLGPLVDDLRLVDIGHEDRLCELDFEFPLVGGEHGGDARVRLGEIASVLRKHLADSDPMRAYADRLENPSLGDQLLRGYLSGSIDVVLRVGGRYLVVDYKTNRLGVPGEPLTALDYTQAHMTEAMLHSHYPLQALLYSVVLHRYLRWRQPGYDPQAHLGGICYLYLRGMCGPETPVVDGIPCGVFSWRPPAELVVELSELMDGRRS